MARFNQRFNDEEKRLLSTGDDDVKVGVIRHELEEERPYDSSLGVGTAVGLPTSKVISYATRHTICWVYVHDCCKNNQGSSKSMEANVAIYLFSVHTAVV